MIDEAVISAGPGETRVALLDAGRTLEFIVDRGEPASGDVMQGRITELSSAFGAAFVDLGQALPGYLPKPKDLSVGTTVLVQVVVAARPSKGAELKRAPSGAKPLRRSGLVRALALYPQIARVTVDRMSTLGEARGLFRAASHAPKCFETSGAAEALEAALARRVPLPGGATLIIAETEAGTMIDIDGGGMAPGSANAAALPEIARQLRLRGIAGHILVDVIPTRDRNAVAKLLKALRNEVVDDPAPVQIAGRTPLGMIELTRRRHGPSLAEIMLDPSAANPNALTVGLDGLRALIDETVARPGAVLSLAVPPRVARALYARQQILDEAGRLLGRPVKLAERADLDMFSIEASAQ